MVGLHDKTLEVMFEDLNDSLEVSEDDEDEFDDTQAGKLSACAEESFHNVVTQTSEEVPDNNETNGKETDDKFGTEVKKEMLNYDEKMMTNYSMNETLDVLYGDLDNTLEVNKDDATSNEENEIKVEHPSLDENADVALKDDEDKPEKIIKMLFRGTFSDNSVEILLNLNKFNKISSGNSAAHGFEPNYSPENVRKSSLEILAEDHDSKDSRKEILQVSEAAKDISAIKDLSAKANEPEDVEDILEKVVGGVNAQMLTAALTDWFTTNPIAKFSGITLMCQLMLMYIYLRQFVALSPLLAMFNMFVETNTEFMEKLAQKVKMRRNNV